MRSHDASGQVADDDGQGRKAGQWSRADGGSRMGAVVPGGFVDRIAETIARAGTATG